MLSEGGKKDLYKEKGLILNHASTTLIDSEFLLLPAVALTGCKCAPLAIKHGRIILGKGRLPFHLFNVHSTVR